MVRSTRPSLLALGVAGACCSWAAADPGTSTYGADQALTSSTLNGGDRALQTLRFAGSATVVTGADFLRFNNGSLTNNVGTYGWNTPIPSDLSDAGAYSGNPDRADSATPFASEGAGAGTLADVFGPFSGGYKNMSYLIDGEDNGAWTLDLFLAGLVLSADADASTVELAIVERGLNSDISVRGIRADHSLTEAFLVTRGSFASAGWSLNSLEIGGAQAVGAVGLSLDASWTNLVGFRFEAASGMNGPDLVGVAVVPAPGSAALMGLGGLLAVRRRR
jgi:hypothetical protein